MTIFISDDFLLQSDVAQELYHDHAKHQPIFDYHCYLPPDQIAGDRHFDHLYRIWLEGDHYKWRAMRSNINKSADATSTGDPDGDGNSNLAEYAFNGDPLAGSDNGQVYALKANSDFRFTRYYK